MAVNHLEKYGRTLSQAGFDIVPLLPRGKNPVLKGWNDVKASKVKLKEWVDKGYTGVGIRTRWTPMIDLDISDPETVRAMFDYCKGLIGKPLIRIGRSPRMSLMYRTSEPFKKLYSKKFLSDAGETQQVEVLGHGQQSAMLGVHPDTDNEFYYVTEDGELINIDDPLHNDGHILDATRDGLTTVTAEQAAQVIKHFESIVPPWWGIVKNSKSKTNVSRSAVDPGDDAFMLSHTETLTITNKKVVGALEGVSSDCDYHDWIKVGAALWHQFNGKKIGLDLWDEWSRTAPSYEEGLCALKWDSFEPDGVDRPTTFASVLGMAKDGRAEAPPEKNKSLRQIVISAEPVESDDPDDFDLVEDIQHGDYLLDEYLERYIFVEADSEVFDTRLQSSVALIPYGKFSLAQANRRMEITTPTQAEPDKTKMIPVCPAWLASVDRKTVRKVGYFPRKKLIYKDRGITFINEFFVPLANTNFTG